MLRHFFLIIGRIVAPVVIKRILLRHDAAILRRHAELRKAIEDDKDEFVDILNSPKASGYDLSKEVVDYVFNQICADEVFVIRRKPVEFEGASKAQDSRSHEKREDDGRRHYLEVHGLTDEATKDEIRKAYREKSKEFHPDVIQGKGLNEIFVKFAEEQFKILTEAYEALMAE